MEWTSLSPSSCVHRDIFRRSIKIRIVDVFGWTTYTHTQTRTHILAYTTERRKEETTKKNFFFHSNWIERTKENEREYCVCVLCSQCSTHKANEESSLAHSLRCVCVWAATYIHVGICRCNGYSIRLPSKMTIRCTTTAPDETLTWQILYNGFFAVALWLFACANSTKKNEREKYCL